jgi:hypothetical protein
MGLRPSHFPTGNPSECATQSCPRKHHVHHSDFLGTVLFQEKRKLIRKLALEFSGKPLINRPTLFENCTQSGTPL